MMRAKKAGGFSGTAASEIDMQHSKWGVNLQQLARYGNSWPLINLAHGDDLNWSDGNFAAKNTWLASDGWISGLPAGEFVAFHPIAGGAAPDFEVRTGTYYVTWDGPATVAFTSNSVTGSPVVVSQNKGAITVNTGSSSGAIITVKITNNTGGPIDFNASNNLRVYHADDETDLLAGEVFQRSWLAKLGNPYAVRFMPWSGANAAVNTVNTTFDVYYTAPLGTSTASRIDYASASFTAATVGKYVWATQGPNAGRVARVTSINSATSVNVEDADNHGNPMPAAYTAGSSTCITSLYREVEDYPTESWRDWVFAMPAVIMGKLCAKLNCHAHIAVPVTASDALISHFASSLYSYMPTGKKVMVEVGNEIWNTAGAYLDERNYLRGLGTLLGTAVDNAGAASSAQNDLAMCGLADRSLNAWKLFESVFGRSRVVRMVGGWMGSPSAVSSVMENTDPGYISAGVKVKNLVDEWCFAPYIRARNSGGAVFSTLTALLNKYYLLGNVDLKTKYEAGVDEQAAFLSAMKTLRDQKRRSIALTCYEFGLDTQDVDAPNYNSMTGDTSNNALQDSDSITVDAMYDDNDFVTFNVSPFTGWVSGTRYPVKKSVSNTRLQVFANQAAYDANTPVTINAGSYQVRNRTRADLWKASQDAFKDSQECADLYQEMYDTLLKHDTRITMHYFDIGGFQGAMWGYARKQYVADTPLVAWVKSKQ